MTAANSTPVALDPAGASSTGERPSTASPHRYWTPDRPRPAGGTVISVKRACNGCGNLLGDVTDDELGRAIAGLPAADVRAECPTCGPTLADTAPRDQVVAFNEDHPVGTPVRFWTGAREGAGRTGVTDAPAEMLGGEQGVPAVRIRLDDGSGRQAVYLTHVDPITGPAQIEVTLTVSWRVTVDPASPNWSWLANNPRAEWPELIQQDLEHEPSAYDAICEAAEGPHDGPTYDVEEIR